MATGILSPTQRSRIAREMASEVAVVIAGVETVDVDGNVFVPKPPLVAALASYFESLGANRTSFVELAYSA